MSRIQISTVNKFAPIQVIELDANFVARVTMLAVEVNNRNNDLVQNQCSNEYYEIARFFNDMLDAFTGESHPTAGYEEKSNLPTTCPPEVEND